MFVTVFYGVFAAPSRRLTFARAGHDYPLLFRGDGAVEQLAGKGTVLGMLELEAAQLTEEQTDVFNEASERLELPRLQAILQEQRAAAPDEICGNTFAALSAFQGGAEQFDDMTIVVVGVE
jgi:sigma-B regulation protein RsbU (phosphoserine phosphatase)